MQKSEWFLTELPPRIVNIYKQYCFCCFCCVAWEVYVRIMGSYQAKSYFLACKMQREVFIRSVLVETISHDTYSSILETTCLQDHPLKTFL